MKYNYLLFIFTTTCFLNIRLKINIFTIGLILNLFFYLFLLEQKIELNIYLVFVYCYKMLYPKTNYGLTIDTQYIRFR